MCVPFNLESVADLNDDVRTLAVKSMTQHEEDGELITTIELYDKESFAAGEPCIIWIGNPEGDTDSEDYELVIPFPTEITDIPLNGNGIAGCLHGSGFPAFTAYSTGREYVVATDGVGIGAQTGVIDPDTYRGPVEGVETGLTIVLRGLRAIGNKTDVDGNGNVNSADVVAVYNYILIGEESGITADKADVDGNGDVNSADVVAIYNSIIGSASSKFFIGVK